MARFRTRNIVMLLLVGLVMSPAMNASASPPEAADAASRISAEELIDLQLIADERGISLDQAINDVAWQDDFAILATELEERFPDEFAGAEIVDAAGRVASIAFKGTVPPAALASAADFGLAEVRVTGARGHSVRELDERVAEVHAAVARRRDLVGEVVSTYDPETGDITVEVAPRLPAASGGPAPEALVAELRAAVPPQARAAVAAIVVDPSLRARGENALGGARIERAGASGLECTTGFSARTPAGVTGIVTAGHCWNSTTYEDFNGAPEVSMGNGRSPGGDWGDFQFQTVANTEVDDFYYNWSVTRDVAAIANPVSGQTLCKFGQTFGAGCANVQDLSACATVNSAEGTYTACRLVRTDNDISEPGDSGGPWYYGTTAYGIHWGTFGTWLGDRSAFSRATYVDEALNGTTLLR